MENRRGSGIFLGVIGVATLVVAIIGATFAYFSASAISNNDAIRVQGANLSLGYADDPSGLKTNLIPTAEKYALYAGTNAEWIEDDKECLDDYSSEICGAYYFTIGNPNTTAMNINGRVTTTVNEFENLMFAIYDEANVQVVEPTAFPKNTGGFVELDELDQQLIGTPMEGRGDNFDSSNPTTFTPLVDKSDPTNADEVTNVRTYKMIIWIEETGENQTDDDSGKVFTAGITFDTGDGSGVTGIITAAD